MGRARIEPDVEQRRRSCRILRVVIVAEKPRLGPLGEPGVGAFRLESVGDALVDLVVDEDVMAALLTKTAIGTPQALAAHHPVSLLPTMPLMRFSPEAGTQRVSLIAPSAVSRSVAPL